MHLLVQALRPRRPARRIAQSEAGRLPPLHGSAPPLRGAGFGRRAADARRCGGDRTQHQERLDPALHDPGFQLVSHDAGEVPGAARRRHRPVLGQPRLSRPAPRRFPRLPGPLQPSGGPDPATGQTGARRYRAQQLHHQRESGRDRSDRGQGARVGRESLLQRLFGAAHGLPRLLPGHCRNNSPN